MQLKTENKMKTLNEIKVKEIGHHEIWEQFQQISDFVVENFDLLYEGAMRLKINIESDYYAPRRISIHEKNRSNGSDACGAQTRLHESIGLKYANGYKYSSDYYPKEEDLIVAIRDIQMLIDTAASEVKSSIKIQFTHNKR